MPKIKPKLKLVNPAERTYHVFKYSDSYYSMFDGADDGVPVCIGSWGIISQYIVNLSRNVTIFWYKFHDKGYWIEEPTKRTTPAKTQNQQVQSTEM